MKDAGERRRWRQWIGFRFEPVPRAVVPLRCDTFRLDVVLSGRDAADRIENLGDSVVRAFAGMFELVGKIVLVLCVALQTGNTAPKIVDFRPALSPCDGGVVDTRGGRLPRPTAAFQQIERKILKIPFAMDIALVGSQLVPGQGPGIVRLHALPVLIHPAELIFRVAVPVRRSFDEP